MFQRLRNRLVLINVIITSVVLLLAFCTIYFVAQNSADKRPLAPNGPEFSLHEDRDIDERVRIDRRSSLNSLAISLVVVGIVVEVSVVLVSLVIAEIAIRPVREAYEAQKNFIANASHEMKTPLAAIAANLEAADIQDNRWLTNALSEVDLLSAMNQELLALASAENIQAKTSATEEINVQKFVQETLQSFESKANAKKLTPKVTIVPANAKLNIQVADLRQILRILIDNAIKYSKKKVTIEYHENSFLIKNDGRTIPEKDLPHVFDRFYQVDKTAEGSGLGLAIAKALAERNSWKLLVTSSQTTTFTLKLK